MKPYEIVINQILDKLDEWTLPWQRTRTWWIPSNYETGIEYRWLNKLILLFDNYQDKRYLTAKQITKLWWHINKWEKATKVIFFKYQEETEDENKINYPIVKYYNIFNIEQTSWINLEPKKQITPSQKYNKAQQLIENYKQKPKIISWPNPCYIPLTDTIEIPTLDKFKTIEDYYSTLFHELVHSTWIKQRLNRFWNNTLKHSKQEYSFEELVAEIGSMFLMHEMNILYNNQNNNVLYIKWWLEYLNNNKKHIIYASSQAQKATDYILQNTNDIHM